MTEPIQNVLCVVFGIDCIGSVSWEYYSVLFIRSEAHHHERITLLWFFMPCHFSELLWKEPHQDIEFCLCVLYVCLFWCFFLCWPYGVMWFTGTFHQIIQLLLSSTEKLTFQNAPSPQEFNEGDDAVIVCDVISSPPPTIIWKYQRTKIQPEKDGKRSTLSAISPITYTFFYSYVSHRQHVHLPHSLKQTPRQTAAFSKAVIFTLKPLDVFWALIPMLCLSFCTIFS